MGRNLLNEGISPIVYHFCPLYALYKIVETNSFKLTSVDRRPSDRELTRLPVNTSKKMDKDKHEYKSYNYYLCFSRSPSSIIGYPMMKREREGYILWKYCLVRLKINGDLLNANYKGMPVNYFNDKSSDRIDHFFKKDSNGKIMPDVIDSEDNKFADRVNINVVSPSNPNEPKKGIIKRGNPHSPNPMSMGGEKKEGTAYIDYGEIDRNQMTEFEDRLFSNKEYINNAFRYIERIDIFVDNRILTSPDNKRLKDADNALEIINYIIDKHGDITYIYDSLSAFESSNFQNSTTIERLKAKTHEYVKSIDYKKFYINSTQTKNILIYVMLVLYHPLKNYLQQTYDYIVEHEFPDINEAKEIALELYNKFSQNDPNFILRQQLVFSREIPRLSPFIYNKYIAPIDEIKNNLEEAEGLSIATIKKNLAINYNINQKRRGI